MATIVTQREQPSVRNEQGFSNEMHLEMQPSSIKYFDFFLQSLIYVKILSLQATQKYGEICDLTLSRASVEAGDFKSRTGFCHPSRSLQVQGQLELQTEDPMKRREPNSGSRDGVLEEMTLYLALTGVCQGKH